MKIKDLPKEIRPREKALAYGISSLSDQEILALLIRTGTRKESALALANNVLKLTKGLKGLNNVHASQLMTISGIKDAKALEIMAIVEISKRISRFEMDQSISIEEPQSLMKWLNQEIGYKHQEHFMAVYLNHQLKVLGHQILFKGTVDKSLIHPRDLFRESMKLNASRIILVHNHPGKTLEASQADLHTTRALVDGARILGIEILDHIIVSHGAHSSIRSQHAYLFEE